MDKIVHTSKNPWLLSFTGTLTFQISLRFLTKFISKIFYFYCSISFRVYYLHFLILGFVFLISFPQMLTKLVYFYLQISYLAQVPGMVSLSNPVGPFTPKTFFSTLEGRWRTLCRQKLLMNSRLVFIVHKDGYAQYFIVPTMKEFTAVLLFSLLGRSIFPPFLPGQVEV